MRTFWPNFYTDTGTQKKKKINNDTKYKLLLLLSFLLLNTISTYLHTQFDNVFCPIGN